MSEHTPGPWGVFGKGVSVAKTEWTFGPQICRQPISRSVARNWEANARLIAAAPDLLNACKMVRGSVFAVNALFGDFDEKLRLLDAVIAKAEGRE